MATDLISVDVTGVDREAEDRWRKMEALDDFVARVAGLVAQKAQQRMSGTLEPGHRFNVGATGRAAKNVRLGEGKRGKGHAVITVEEGDLTPANYLIRLGFHGSKNPPAHQMRLWLAAKGITLRGGDEEGGIRYIKSKSKYGVSYGRSFNQAEKANRQLFALLVYMRQHGSKGGHLMQLYPSGKPYFDYPGYTMKSDSFINYILDQETDYLKSVMVDYRTTFTRNAPGFGRGRGYR